MKSLFTKSLVPSVLVAISLALSGGIAMAAQAQIHHSTKVAHAIQPHAAARVAARYRQPSFAGNNDLGQFIASFFGGVMPQQYAHRQGSGRYVASPSYDNAPTIDTSSAATDAQAASDQEVQQIQQMNDESALNASMAAAEQQNDAANAATLQTEINAGF